MGKASISIPPSSRLDIAKDNMIGSLVFFCLKNHTIKNHINSLMPDGDRRPYILREI